MIKQLPEAERPRERCLAFGAETLSLRECLAVLLGSGPRGKGCMGLASDMMRANLNDEQYFLRQWQHVGPALFDQIHGLGPAQKARLLACFEIANRLACLKNQQDHVPKELNLSALERLAVERISSVDRSSLDEWIGFIGVFKTGALTDLKIVARGQSQQVTFDKQRLFLEVLLIGVPGFILVHNHPSGDLHASKDDLHLTDVVKNLAEQLSLQCLSHLIVSAKGARSITELI